MRIALDATLWDEPITGIGLYTREVYRALCEAGHEVERWGARRSGERPRGNVSRSLFALHTVPKWLTQTPPDLFHAVSNFNLPLFKPAGVRFSLTVHDLIPLLLPHTVSAAYRWQFRLWLSRSVSLADQVICVSETTRAALLAQHPLANAVVAWNGVDHVERVPEPDATSLKWLDALGLPKGFVLYAGALDARKNVEAVLAACAQLPGTTLVLAGQRWFGGRDIEKRIQAAARRGLDVRTLGHLDAPLFYALMKRAGVFAFPSRYEGFGLPPLEAMRLGVPTVVGSGGALPEVVGDAALVVNPDDSAGLAAAISRLRAERAEWSRKGRERAKHFTWAAHVAKCVL